MRLVKRAARELAAGQRRAGGRARGADGRPAAGRRPSAEPAELAGGLDDEAGDLAGSFGRDVRRE